MFDITGRTVMQKQVNKNTLNINVNDLPEGYYFLKIKTTSRLSTIKLSIN
jgi:hypothetical protein